MLKLYVWFCNVIKESRNDTRKQKINSTNDARMYYASCTITETYIYYICEQKKGEFQSLLMNICIRKQEKALLLVVRLPRNCTLSLEFTFLEMLNVYPWNIHGIVFFKNSLNSIEKHVQYISWQNYKKINSN